MTIHDYIRILRKGWLLVVICGVIGLGGGATAVILATPMFNSTTKLFVSLQSEAGTNAGELAQGNSFALQKVRSYVDIVGSPAVLDGVISSLNLKTTAGALASSVSASTTANTVTIDITASDPDPQQAANIANATGQSFTNLIVGDLEKPEDGGPSLVKIRTVQPAVAAANPYSPNTLLNLALGGLVGLAIGLSAAFLRAALDSRVHGVHDVTQITTAPILGGIGYDPDSKLRPLIVQVDPRNPRAESFRALRTNLQFVNVNSGPRTFVVTSSIPGEGKTTTTSNLALALAEAGSRVVLIDADLRLPRLADTLGIEGAVGLTDVLIGRADLADVLQPWGKDQLFVLPAGRIPPNPSELLGSAAMVDLLAALNKQVDYVLIDSPPLLPVTDAAIISKLTAGAIIVAAAGKIKRAELAAAIQVLEHIGSRVVGVIVTMVPSKGPDSYRYGQYAYYGGTADSKQSKSNRRRAEREPSERAKARQSR